MKNLKLVLAVLSLNTIVSTAALADYSRVELETISRSESRWRSLGAKAQNFEGVVQVDVTDTGAVRLSALPDRFQSTAELDMPGVKAMAPAAFQKWCSDRNQLFPELKIRRAPHSLKIHLSPFYGPSSIVVQGASVQLENPAVMVSAKPHLSLSKNSISYSQTQIRASDFENEVIKQLQSQLSQFNQSGDAVLDLTGWDDVACDLASGNATLQFDTTNRWEPSRVTRRSVISKDELRAVSNGMKSYFKPQKNVLNGNIIAAISFGASLVSTIKKSPADFDVADLFATYVSLVDLSKGTLSQIVDSDYSVLASGLDHLSREINYASPVVEFSVVVPTR